MIPGRRRKEPRWSDVLGPMALVRQSINRIRNAQDQQQAKLVETLERMERMDRERTK